jgi:beta-glucosidase
MRRSIGTSLAVILAAWQTGHALAQVSQTPPPTPVVSAGGIIKAQDTKGTPDERAEQILRQMTQSEKILMVYGANFNTHPIERLGIGTFTMSDGPQGVRNGPTTGPVGGRGRGPAADAAPATAPDVAAAGARARGGRGGGNASPPACAFPSGAALAATWDVELATAYGKAIGLEARARGSNFQLGPGVNIARLPVNGRAFEYFGEDPFLASQIAVNWVKACSAEGVVPTIKHYAANNQEVSRNTVDAVIDERTLNEIYLPAFKKAAKEGGIIAFMCSYNRLNGSYASNSDYLLNQMLKQQWGFKGLVMSDWGASHSVTDIAKGLDLEMPSGRNLNETTIPAALADGSIKQADLDNSVRRILRTAFAIGWLDAGWSQRNPSLPMDSNDSAKVALDVAQSSIVLLKNERNALPLDRGTVKTIAVLGPNASFNGQMPMNIGGGGSGLVTPYASRIPEADYLQGITRAAGSSVKVIYLPMPEDNDPGIYNVLANARTAPSGQPGLTLNVQVLGDGEPVKIEPTVVTSINTTWQTGQLPFGVPAGRNAKFTFSGVLMAPADSDWQVGVEGTPIITVAGKTLDVSEPQVIHLVKDAPTPITIEMNALANPPARGRGGQGGGGGAPGGARRGGRGGANANLTLRVGFQKPQIPDLSQVKSADAAIVCVGLNRTTERESADRPFELPGLQQYLINAVGAANPRTVVINNSGAAVGMMNWNKSAAAVMQAWYLGQEGGVAIGNVLFGDYNPSGKLCSTFDKTFEDNPAFAYYPGKTPAGVNYPVAPYTEGIFYGYRGYDKANKEPLYPFGHGLSYTTFELSNMKITPSSTDVLVSLDVKNTGQRAGAEVVQIYVGEQSPAIERPLRELKGFSKVMLNAGQTKRIEISLPKDSFAYWSPAKKDWTIDAGNKFTIEAGVSERDIKLKETIGIQ